MNLKKKITQCPCGEMLCVPRVTDDHYGEIYEVCNLECPKCHRQTTGGNFRTGEISGWITRKELDASQAEYERQMFSAEMNEWYGRGNHPF